MCMCMCVFLRFCVHVRVCVHVHVCVASICVYVRVCVHVHVCARVSRRICEYMCTCSVCVRICVVRVCIDACEYENAIMFVNQPLRKKKMEGRGVLCVCVRVCQSASRKAPLFLIRKITHEKSQANQR